MTAYSTNEIQVLSGSDPLLMFGIRAPSVQSSAALAIAIESHGTVLVKIIPDRRSSKTQDMCQLFTPDGININHWMVQNGLAKAYVGGCCE